MQIWSIIWGIVVYADPGESDWGSSSISSEQQCLTPHSRMQLAMIYTTRISTAELTRGRSEVADAHVDVASGHGVHVFPVVVGCSGGTHAPHAEGAQDSRDHQTAVAAAVLQGNGLWNSMQTPLLPCLPSHHNTWHHSFHVVVQLFLAWNEGAKTLHAHAAAWNIR